MMTFPDLIKKSFSDCNRAGKPLGMAVLLTGSITVMLTLFLWQTALWPGVRELGKILGPDGVARIEEQMRSAVSQPSDMQRFVMAVGQTLEAKLDSMTESERSAATQQAFSAFFAGVLPALTGFVVLSFIIGLWSRSFFLVLGVRGAGSFSALAIDAFAWMLPLLGVGFLMALVLFVWVVLSILVGVVFGIILSNIAGALIAAPITVAGLIYMWPRLIMAPVALVQDRAGIIGSIRSSIRITKGHWLKICGNLIGAWIVVWIVMTAFGFIVTALTAVAGQFPPVQFAINSVMSFITVAGMAYWMVFLVKLKQAIAANPK